MTTYIETERLTLRDWQETDVSPFTEINRDSRVMEYFLKELTPEETLDFYHRITDEFATCGFGLYAVEDKLNHAFIGYVGFHRFTFDADFAPGVEIGWRLTPEAWGKGYATEAAAACLEYARTHLNLKEVYSFTSLPNRRSEKVMQRIGMERVKEFNHPGVPSGHPLLRHVLYKWAMGSRDPGHMAAASVRLF